MSMGTLPTSCVGTETECKMLAITGAVLHSCGPQSVIDRGVLLIKGRTIAAIGFDGEVPPSAEIVDTTGLIVTPGFVDAHAHVGIGWQELAGEADTNESTGIGNAHQRVIDSVDPRDVAFQDAIEGRVTTTAIHSGKPHVGNGAVSPIAGQSVVMKMRGGIGQREVLREPAGLMLAMGEEVLSWLVSRRIGPGSPAAPTVPGCPELPDEDGARYRHAARPAAGSTRPGARSPDACARACPSRR